MTDNTSRIFYILMQMEAKDIKERLISEAPKIIDLLKRISNNDMEQAGRSSDGALFGYFVKTTMLPAMIRAEFDKSELTRNTDSLLIFEVGDKFTGSGFSRAWTWLQHRQSHQK